MGVIVTSGGLAYLADFLARLNPAPPSYIAIGTNTTPSRIGRYVTAVPDEAYRTPIVSVTRDGPAVTFNTFLTTTAYSGQVGWYGLVGGAATGALGTGTLIAIGNDALFAKPNTQTAQLEMTLTVSGVVTGPLIMTSGGLDYVAAFMAGEVASIEPPAYIAVGSGAEPVSRFMTHVPGETYRTGYDAADRVGQAVVYHVFLATQDDANETLGTIGLYGGAATQEKDSGTLIAITTQPDVFGKQASNTYAVDLILTASGTVS